ncbi:hypothetical protein HDV63DRAFT_404492 [Trichoderma sp. SZMC 28014]
MQCFGFYDMLPSDVTSATLRAKIGAASAGHEAALEVIHSKFVQHVALASVAPLTENPKDAPINYYSHAAVLVDEPSSVGQQKTATAAPFPQVLTDVFLRLRKGFPRVCSFDLGGTHRGCHRTALSRGQSAHIALY